MVPEAPLERTDAGLVPAGDGWFVVNVRDARWFDGHELGYGTSFESENARFRDLGINVNLLLPGQPSCMYHGEGAQEGFLVVSGECVLIVEGQERTLRAWDFVHCPAWTEHVIVGAGDGPCVFIAVGARLEGPRDHLSRERHGAQAWRGSGDGDERPERGLRPLRRAQAGPVPRRVPSGLTVPRQYGQVTVCYL